MATLVGVGGLALVGWPCWIGLGWYWWAGLGVECEVGGRGVVGFFHKNWRRHTATLLRRMLLMNRSVWLFVYVEPVGEVHAHGERGLCDSCSPCAHQPRMSQSRFAGKEREERGEGRRR